MPRRKSGTILPLELSILEAGIQINSEGEPFYGFSLARRLAGEDPGKSLTAHGTLYKALGRLVDRGLLEAEWESPEFAEAEGRPRRRLYTVSGEGERVVASQRRPLPFAARVSAAGGIA